MPTGQKRQYEIVKCIDCSKVWSKRVDSMKAWNNKCQDCSRKSFKPTIEHLKIMRQNGINYVKKFGHPISKNRPCGEKHYLWRKSITGEQSKNWRGGLTSKHELERHSLKYRFWREAVFARDNFTCIACGDNRGGNLNADHIKPFALFPELRFDVNNGRTFCKKCHKKYGAKVGSNGQIREKAKFFNGTAWVSH